MKGTLKPGLSREYTITVDVEMATKFLGEGVTPVYSTPSMIYHMENVCRLMLEPHLDGGEQSVGTRLDIKHLAATPLKMKVTTASVLRSVEGKKCIFEVVASDEREKIGEGIHERFIIDIEKFDSKVRAKLDSN